MKEELKYAFAQLEKALIQLRKGTEEARTELEEDGVIQRFEFTFELFWKTLRIFLQDKGILASTPRDVFKEAFRVEWLDNEEVFLNMLEDRNKTSHIYDMKTSREIFARIKNNYVCAIEGVLQKIEKIAKIKNKQGFTLMELLVSLVIVAMITTGFMATFIAASRFTTRNKLKTEALSRAREKLEELKTEDYESISDSSDTVTYTDTRQAERKWTIKKTTDKDGFSFKEIEVKLNWQEE